MNEVFSLFSKLFDNLCRLPYYIFSSAFYTEYKLVRFIIYPEFIRWNVFKISILFLKITIITLTSYYWSEWVILICFMRENNNTAQISNLLLFFEKNDGSLNNDQGEIMRSQCSILERWASNCDVLNSSNYGLFYIHIKRYRCKQFEWQLSMMFWYFQ